MNNIQALSPVQFKHYITGSRAVRIDQVCELECKFGSVKFDFSELGPMVKCVIYLRRTGGQGQIEAVSGNHSFTGNILSKTSQYFSIELAESALEIRRPASSTGSIEIIKIELHSEPKHIEQVSVASQWKEVLAKCKEYQFLRLSNGRLFAAEGAFAIAEAITSVETNPPNMFILQGNTVKFAGSCEVLRMDVEGSAKNNGVNFLPHMEPPAAIYSPPVLLTKATVPQTVTQVGTIRQPVEPSPTANTMLYDSASNANFTTVKTSGAVTIGDKIARLGHTGSISIPISSMQPAHSYIVTIEAQKINGNGKLCLAIQPSTATPTLLFMAPQLKPFNTTLPSGNNAPDGAFKLVVSRPHSATGEVAISRIMVQVGPPILHVPHGLSVESPDSIQPMGFSSFNHTLIFDKLIPVPLSNNVRIRSNEDRKFAVVIPSYNNEQWVERNLSSALGQNYPNFRVLFVDDCSKDNTFQIAKTVAGRYKTNSVIVKNETRIGALANLYNAIHSCADDEIVLTLDGDDWLANANVLSYLNDVYKSGDTWLTYGQYQNHPDGAPGISQEIPQHIIDINGFRQYKWCASHLRTFYAWLFKKIARSDLLMPEGDFYPMTWDFAIMFPMLEMANSHSKFISQALYIYNLENPINDHKVNRKLQASLDSVIRHKHKYNPVTINKADTTEKVRVGLMFIATNKYRGFLHNVISSADRYFLCDDKFDVTYYVFSDEPNVLASNRRVIQQHIPHRPFPYASMDRFRHFVNHRHILEANDYLYYVDVDTLFVDHVGPEILGNLVGVRHCGFYNGGGSFETNPQSALFLPPSKYRYYYGGGFSGGKTGEYLDLSQWCADKIDEDLSKQIMPVWHDETALNRYFATRPPEKTLSPSYHYPQGNLGFFRAKWGNENFSPKIVLLDKPHSDIRK